MQRAYDRHDTEQATHPKEGTNTAVTPPNSEPVFPGSPREFLASWSATRGNLRRFLEERALPPLGEEHQRAAGEASAAAAVQETFGIELDAFSSGVDSVSGSIEAAGGFHISVPDPDIPQDIGAAAFFDVDNTLIQGSSLVVFALGLARKRYFRLREVLPIAWKQIKFRVTGSENANDVAVGRNQALEFIKGKSVAELVELCEEIVDSTMIDKAWPGTRDLAQMHLAAGHQVWLVSATPVQLAQILAKRFGFTGALGTVAEVVDGKFTGRLVGDILHGPGKMHAVAALAAIEQLDLARCTAYSDSINDVPMLSMVGTAVAINPDSKLRKEAVKRGWQVRDYRNLRRAVRTFGLPALATAAFSLSSWRVFHGRRAPKDA
ncbi:HAD-IB family hydrolase [Corynebacterium testudinoris]|uniref:HAD-superfamily subfamily IB hydrolase, TIGR01490 n=1 Tax=Corynebacterium testudinoris TaxID=136857 RepID=A0A0G3H301_9CORY|nr:HAD-superfamily subfamily IB hydrolase, TIGR01490 [Corynebacterium testudinoris]MBX8995891.1 HAD-IB family hydrolase [Corynebacterium testudinoris]